LARGADPAVPSGYERQVLEGFTVLVNKEVLTVGADQFGRRPLTVLERELNDLRRILHPQIVGVLQSVPIWAEWDRHDKLSPGAVARYYGGAAEGLAKMGGDPRKANCVEVLTLRTLGDIRSPGTALQQIIILHEMAHVVQHRLLGWDNPELETTFQAARERKLYDGVNDRFGRRTKAYASTNAAEYFAEVSCAYLDSCNYYPFNNQQLRGYDSQGYAFVERVWKSPERFGVIAQQTAKSVKPGVAVASAEERTDAYAERDAYLKLDKLRALSKQPGKKEDAKAGLRELLKVFGKTEAAADAKELLATLK
jgi:hypothetical protein